MSARMNGAARVGDSGSGATTGQDRLRERREELRRRADVRRAELRGDTASRPPLRDDRLTAVEQELAEQKALVEQYGIAIATIAGPGAMRPALRLIRGGSA